MVTHDEKVDNTREHLASNLRRLRIASHLSLSELARVTSVSKATLSGIENGHGNPTVDTLTLLSNALRVSVAELLEEAQMGDVRIIRAAGSDPWPVEAAGKRPLGALELRGDLDTFELVLGACHVEHSAARKHGSRNEMLLLQGKLIAGPVERISELAAGDYISFPADVPHLYETGRAGARALVLAYTPA